MPIILLIMVLCVLSSCALPTPLPKTPVTEQELYASLYSDQAQADFAVGRYIDAALRYERILHMFPDADNIRFNLAFCYGKVNLPDDAESMLRYLIDKYPKETKYKVALGETFFDAARYDKAFKVYSDLIDEAREKKNDDLIANTLHSMATVELMMGNERNALCASNASLAYRSTREDAVRHARLLLALNAIDLADLFLSSYFLEAANQKDAYALYGYALVRVAENRFSDAYLLAKRALVFNKKNQDLEYEIKLLEATIYDRVDQETRGPSDASEDEDVRKEKEEKRLTEKKTLLSDKRIWGEDTLYWPVRYVELVHDEAARELKDQNVG